MVDAGQFTEVITAPTRVIIHRPPSSRPSTALPTYVTVLGSADDSVGPAIGGRARGLTLANGVRKIFGGLRGAAVAVPPAVVKPVYWYDEESVVKGVQDGPKWRSPSAGFAHSATPSNFSNLAPAVLPSPSPCAVAPVPLPALPAMLPALSADQAHLSPDFQVSHPLPILNMSYAQLLEVFPHVVARLNTQKPAPHADLPSSAENSPEDPTEDLCESLGDDHPSPVEPGVLTPFLLDASPSVSTASPEVVTPEIPVARMSCDRLTLRLADVDKPLPPAPVVAPVGSLLLSPFRQAIVRPSTGTLKVGSPFGAKLRLRVRPSTAQPALDVDPSPARYGSLLLLSPPIVSRTGPLVQRSTVVKHNVGPRIHAEGQEPIEYLAPNYRGPPSSAFPSCRPTPPSQPVASTSRLASTSVDSFATAATFKSTFSRTPALFLELFRLPAPAASAPEALTRTEFKGRCYTVDGQDVREILAKALNERPLGEKVKRRLTKWGKGVGEVVRSGAMFGPKPAGEVDRKGKGREL